MLVDDSVQDKRYSRFIELVKLQYSGAEHSLVWCINTIVNDPKLIQFRVDVYTGDDAYSFDDSMCISAILTLY